MSEKEESIMYKEPLIFKKIDDEESKSNLDDNNSQNNTSFSKICFHGINALSGVGILSVPYALASGGWLSLLLLFLIAITTFYCSILIKKCLEMDPLLISYPDIGHKAFGNTGRIIVSIFINLELYLVATSFLILEGDNLNKLFSNVEFNFMGFEFEGKQVFIVVVAFVIVPTVWLDDMKILSYVSASGVFASCLILVSLFWIGAFDGVGFGNCKPVQMFRFSGISRSVSLYMFCYCAHPVFPTLYSSMKNKRQFSNVMIICFTICTFIYASVAILGYLMYGPNLQSQITLNLPVDKLSSKVAIWTTLINPIAKFALMVKPIIDSIRIRLSTVLPNKKSTGLILGTTLVITNVIFALLLPFFGDLMSLVGALLSATASVILPCLCYLKISGKYRKFRFETLVLIGIVLIGIVIVITGTYQAVKDILSQF